MHACDEARQQFGWLARALLLLRLLLLLLLLVLRLLLLLLVVVLRLLLVLLPCLVLLFLVIQGSSVNSQGGQSGQLSGCCPRHNPIQPAGGGLIERCVII